MLSVSDPDLLGAGKRGQAQGGGRSATVSGVVSGLPTPETLSFLHALCSFDWGEFRQGDSVHIHGIRIMVRARWRVYLRGDFSLT